MHFALFSVIALVGMSTCMWILGDLFRILVLDCMLRCHKCQSTRRKIIVDRLIEAHIRIITKTESVDITMEELVETTVEVMGPFLE